MGRKLGLLLAFLLAVGLSVTGVALAHPDHEGCDTNAVSDREGVIDSAVEAQTAKSPCDKQHGGDEGHLPPRQSNVKVVGKAPIDTPVPGRVADVGVFKNHAYLAAFNEPDCQRGGVYVFDIKNPKSPSQVGFI